METSRLWRTLLAPLLLLFFFGPSFGSLSSSSQGLALEAPEKGWRGGRDAIRIRIPRDWPASLLARLALELDGVDVTGMVARETDHVVYRPVEPLSPGRHELRVVEYALDGSVEERGVWQLEVRYSRLFREARGHVAAELTAARRLDATDAWKEQGKEWSGNGSLRLEGAAGGGEWRADAHMDLGYSSGGNGSAARRRLELSNYLLNLERGTIGAKVGHFSPLAGSLLSAGSSYRGIQVDLGVRDRRRYRFSAFMSRPDSESGFQHGLGVTDPKNRLAGGAFTLFPLEEHPERLVLQAMAYGGEGTLGGEGSYGAEYRQKGRGIVFSGSSQLFEGKLKLHGEYARTRWNGDASGTLMDDVNDDAWLLGMALDGQLNSSSATPLLWTFKVSVGRIGTYYYSLMNPAQQSDQKAAQFSLGIARGGLQAGASFRRVENNVDEVESFPTSRLDDLRLDLSYGFDRPLAGFVTSVGLDGSRVRGRPVTRPLGYPYPLANDSTRTLGGRLSFALFGGTGDLRLTTARNEDFTGVHADSRTNGWSLGYALGFLENRLIFQPQLSRDVTRYDGGGDRTITENYQLPVTLSGIMDGRLSMGVTPMLNRNRREADSLDEKSVIVSGWISWTLFSPKEGRPDVALSLSGVHQRWESGAGNENDWQLYMGVRVGYGMGE